MRKARCWQLAAKLWQESRDYALLGAEPPPAYLSVISPRYRRLRRRSSHMRKPPEVKIERKSAKGHEA